MVLSGLCPSPLGLTFGCVGFILQLACFMQLDKMATAVPVVSSSGLSLPLEEDSHLVSLHRSLREVFDWPTGVHVFILEPVMLSRERAF